MRQDLKVPKRATAVRLTLADGSAVTVEVFLSTSTEVRGGPERVSDLLNAPGGFFPARGDDGRTAFVQRANVAVARVAAADEDDGSLRHTLPNEIDVVVTLASGATLQGFVSFVRPPESGRLLDHLNDDEPFLRLFDGADALLVNKRLIQRVEARGA